MLIPQLHFCGNCAEAMLLYEDAFDARTDYIAADEDGGILHAEMTIHGQRVMLNDRFGNQTGTADCAVALVLTFESDQKMYECYDLLKEDSIPVIDPLGKEAYGGPYLQFLDRFGIQWVFMIAED